MEHTVDAIRAEDSKSFQLYHTKTQLSVVVGGGGTNMDN